MDAEKKVPLEAGCTEQSRRAYTAPTLSVYGKVAALTCATSGFCQGDNDTCTVPTGTATMRKA